VTVKRRLILLLLFVLVPAAALAAAIIHPLQVSLPDGSPTAPSSTAGSLPTFTPTKQTTTTTTTNIQPTYDKWLEVYVTGYTGEQGYAAESTRTSLGYPPGWGICAVDPSVIPYGSILYVPHYAEMCGRYALAVDCGSGVKGLHIDLWTETNAQAYTLTGYYKVRVLRWGWDEWLVNPKDWGLEVK